MNMKTKIALAAIALTAGSAAMAQVSYNAGVVTDYRYRGISQSALAPAVQGGVDYAHSSGLYIGTWATQIRWISEAGLAATPRVDTKGDVEQDIYFGYKAEINKNVSYDVGYLRYQYWGNTYSSIPGNVNANTDEIYGALNYGALTGKVSYSLSNLFGYQSSQGSTYMEVAYTFDLGNGLTLAPHYGHQEIEGKANSVYSYNDFALALNKDFGKGVSASATAITTDGSTKYYTTNGRKTADTTVVVGLKYSF